MNRYTAAGLISDMREGKKVLYLGQVRQDIPDDLEELLPLLRSYERAQRSRGVEGVTSPPTGGCVRLASVGSSTRAMAYDVIVLDAEPTPEQWQDIASIESRGGELIRA